MAIRKGSKNKKATQPKRKQSKMAKKENSTLMQSPFEELENFFDHYFSANWMRPFQLTGPKFSKKLAPFKGKTPSVDVIDKGKTIVVKAKLPGVEKKDIDITVTHNTVVIKAETSREDKDESGDYYHQEISHGSYARSLLLPAEVNEDKTKAAFHNGILKLTLEKTTKQKRRAVTIE